MTRPNVSTLLPLTELIQGLDLTLPELPPALEGLRLAHVTDLHATRLPVRQRFLRAAEHLGRLKIDLAMFTGDYMSRPGQEPAAVEALRRMIDLIQPRHGCFGVFGNHDTPRLRELAQDLSITWLHNRAVTLTHPSLLLLGLSLDRYSLPDMVELALSLPPAAPGSVRPATIMLTHWPMALPAASDLGVEVMLCGHTHGGQIRPLPWLPLRNSSDLPLRLTSGVLRHRRTLGVVARGLGEVALPWRLFCPPHVPVYTLRRGAALGRPTDLIENVMPW